MMQLKIENLGKKFQYEWIFRDLTYQFEQGQAYAILGTNGSGKSTLLQVIAGILSPSQGSISYQADNQRISSESWFRYMVFASPYLELIEEFTLLESINFHQQFKKLKNGLKVKDFIQILGLEKSKNKPIKYFSSGMKQRLKLGLAFYSQTPILMLDEPTSNLDAQGIEWYKHEVLQNLNNRLTIICSNQPYEYNFCTNLLNINEFK
ncbi:MAG: ABC transporter ATP-binding protein [Microscillaceae bacterium]|jgi:ABC-type multidrug transport system ATPase subunit|nr:ABC transporter ATP-binding protein [Microscillaceae bacterium]